MPWQPTLSYRYAFFQGDDPGTIADEAFDPLFVGFYDWGTWWQGEIAGEYFLANSNSISHLARVTWRLARASAPGCCSSSSSPTTRNRSVPACPTATLLPS